MNTLETAFTAWLVFLSSLSVDTAVVLNPPATDKEIAVLEEAIGFELPTDLVELYKITNGQQDTHRVEPADGKYAVNLMGYDFLSIDQALAAYRFEAEIFADIGDSMDDEISAPRGQFVDTVLWKPGWLPVAGSGANHIAIDLAPPRGGAYGQLISIGADEFERNVLALSLTEFFQTATNTTATDECSLDYGVPPTYDANVPEIHRNNFNPYVLYITEEWNHPYYRNLCEEKEHSENMRQRQEINRPAYRDRVDELHTLLPQWLASKNLSNEQLDAMSMWASLNLDTIVAIQHGESPFGMPDWFVPGGVIPKAFRELGVFISSQFPDGLIPHDFQIPDGKMEYLKGVQFKLACQQYALATDSFEMSIEDYQLVHQFLLEQSVWSAEEFEEAKQSMRDLPEVVVSLNDDGRVGFCGSM